MKQAIRIQLIFILEINLQKNNFSEKYHIFPGRDASILIPKGMEMCIRIPQYKKSIAIGMKVTFILKIKLQEKHFSSKIYFFFQLSIPPF